MQQIFTKARPSSPGSPSTMSSFHHANATIDELTLALSNFSRVSSPEPPALSSCCCGRPSCDNLKAWMEFKSRLESRLILSAEVGQALLEKHEAYVRSHKRCHHAFNVDGDRTEQGDSDEVPELDLVELVRQKNILEKRLNQALANNEATEVSNKTILHELQEARAIISRLTVQQARSVGWEARLDLLEQEKEDLQQERDGETNRAKMAESRLAFMKDKTAKLQDEVRRLQDALAERSTHHRESSEHVLRDARTRLEALHSSQVGKAALDDQTELMTVLESLVGDNEVLKHDNAELQIMLTDSREEIHVLQEEMEEYKAKPPHRSGAGTPFTRQHTYAGSVPSSVGKDSTLHFLNPRSVSAERRFRRPFEPLTPETGKRPLSPTDSLTPSEIRWSSFRHPRSRYPPSHISLDVDETFVNNEEDSSSLDKPKSHKSLLLLSRSRAVQTDPWFGNGSTTPLPFHMSVLSPQDHRSDTSSFSDMSSSSLSAVLERFGTLFHRMAQADALTLTNRLKRQHLKGADVGHLSRSTIKNIIAELTVLHTHHRHLLEDDSVVTPCVRKDFRFLFKLFKDILNELGELRAALNDVILDPSIAAKVSDLALNPNKEQGNKSKERDGTGNSSTAANWMAPISKLFLPSANPPERSGPTPSRSSSTRTPRLVPKREPALSASTVAVNVEFSGTAVGRSTTSTIARTTQSIEASKASPPTASQHSSAVMNIFAGAPRSSSPDPWVVVPKVPRRASSFLKAPNPYGTVSRRTTHIGGLEVPILSRDVDAILDLPSPVHREADTDVLGPLPERPLRRRGMSDSSIHSTFQSQATDEVYPSIIVNTPLAAEDQRTSAWPDAHAVLQTFSRTVQNFRQTASGTLASIGPDSTANPSKTPSLQSQLTQEQQTDETPRKIRNKRGSSPAGLRNLLPTLSSWAVAGNLLDPMASGDALFVGSVRDESFIPRARRATSDTRGHEF